MSPIAEGFKKRGCTSKIPLLDVDLRSGCNKNKTMLLCIALAGKDSFKHYF